MEPQGPQPPFPGYGPPTAQFPVTPPPGSPPNPPARRGVAPWIALAIVAVLGVAGIVVSQLQAKNARDDRATLKAQLAQAEDDADTSQTDLKKQLDDATKQAKLAADQVATSASQLDAAKKESAAKDQQIADLTAQVATAGSVAQGVTGLFPVSLDDLKKVDISATKMRLTSTVEKCTYAQSTCDYLTSAALDADIYQDGGQWIVSMRANGTGYFQAKLVLDATGSFSGSEYINAEGTCNNQPSKPFATVFINPVEFNIVKGQVKGTRLRGYLSDSTDCGTSNFTFEGRTS